jgi:hypothetical protein
MSFKDLTVLSCLREIWTPTRLVWDDRKNRITYITLTEYEYKYYVELGTHKLHTCHCYCRSFDTLKTNSNFTGIRLIGEVSVRYKHAYNSSWWKSGWKSWRKIVSVVVRTMQEREDLEMDCSWKWSGLEEQRKLNQELIPVLSKEDIWARNDNWREIILYAKSHTPHIEVRNW